MRTYSFTIEGAPLVQERARKGKYGQIYDPSSKARKALGYQLLSARQGVKMPILAGLIRLYVVFHGLAKGDLSNALKALEDSGNGVLWKDDRQIIRAYVDVYRTGNPQTEVAVEELS